jgi:hypothetical protein
MEISDSGPDLLERDHAGRRTGSGVREYVAAMEDMRLQRSNVE